MTVKIRRPYDASSKSSITFPTKTMTKQSFQDECDINTIMSKYQKTGLFEQVQKVEASYGDFTSVQDYQLSLNQVIAAQEAFDQLPSRVRERFANDPSHLMRFISDEKNYDEALKMGLIEPKAPPAPPQRVEIVNPAPPAPQSPPSPAQSGFQPRPETPGQGSTHSPAPPAQTT